MTTDLKDINKSTKKRKQPKTNKHCNDQSEISCLGPLLDDQILGDPISEMPSKLGSSLEIKMEQALPKKYVSHLPLSYRGGSQETATDELSQEIIKIFGSRDNVRNQERALLPTDELSLPKQKGTPNSSGLSTDPEETSDEGASTIDTLKPTRRLLTETRSSERNITSPLKRKEPKIKMPIVNRKTAIDFGATNDTYPRYQYDSTLFDTIPKNRTKFYIDHPSDTQKSTGNERISSACNYYGIYDVKKTLNTGNQFNAMPFYNPCGCIRGSLITERIESQGHRRRRSLGAHSDLKKRKKNFHQDRGINTTTLNNIENCSFKKKQTSTDAFRIFSKNLRLSSTVSRDSLLRPSNISSGGRSRIHYHNNYNQKQRKLRLSE